MQLVTGEEKIGRDKAPSFVCTVEAMPLDRPVGFLAVDEIQLCADPERGHVFTDRLLHARGMDETMLLGSGTIAPLIKRLMPDAEIDHPAAHLDPHLHRREEAAPACPGARPWSRSPPTQVYASAR